MYDLRQIGLGAWCGILGGAASGSITGLIVATSFTWYVSRTPWWWKTLWIIVIPLVAIKLLLPRFKTSIRTYALPEVLAGVIGYCLAWLLVIPSWLLATGGNLQLNLTLRLLALGLAAGILVGAMIGGPVGAIAGVLALRIRPSRPRVAGLAAGMILALLTIAALTPFVSAHQALRLAPLCLSAGLAGAIAGGEYQRLATVSHSES